MRPIHARNRPCRVRTSQAAPGVKALLSWQRRKNVSGGNTTAVVRIGDTVRRPVGPWTPAVHDLLNHLAAVGFPGSPRVLGIDDADREILEFVPGEAGCLSAANPLPAWFRTPES